MNVGKRQRKICHSCPYYHKGYCSLIKLSVYGKTKHCYSKDINATAEDLVWDVINYIKKVGVVKSINVAKVFGLSVSKMSVILDKIAKTGALQYKKFGRRRMYYIDKNRPPTKEQVESAIKLVSEVYPFKKHGAGHYVKTSPEYERYEFYQRYKKFQESITMVKGQ